MSYLESDINRLGDCSWQRGVREVLGHLAWLNTTISGGNPARRHVEFLSARSHPARYPEGKLAYGARIQRGQNGFIILKLFNYMGEGRGQGGSLPHPIPSPKHKRERPNMCYNCEVMVLQLWRKAQGPAMTWEGEQAAWLLRPTGPS